MGPAHGLAWRSAHGGHALPRDQAAADVVVCTIHLIVTAKNGISSVELGRRGVKQPTAWAVKHKIAGDGAARGGDGFLRVRVEMDDAYLGGVRSVGKRGRGAAG